MSDPEIIATTGWTTNELSDGIAKADPKGPYDLVSLLIGVNNQYRGWSLEEYKEQFAGLLTQAIGFASGRADRVVVVSIPDWGVTPFAAGRDQQKIAREIDAFNAAARLIAEQSGVAFVDITPGSRLAASDSSLVAEDGLHPSGKMYSQWVELIFPVVRPLLND
jgi:lysophospholipase L1-like esterase